MNLAALTRYTLLAAAAALPLAASADRLPMPTDAPPSFQAECSGCHLPFAPQLLTAPDWRRVMSRLNQHYGDNASLDEKTRAEIEAFLLRHAATRDNRATTTAAGELPRLTRTPWFEREHRKVPAPLWRDARVVSAANCTACHRNAEQGSFKKRDLLLPELQRRKHGHD